MRTRKQIRKTTKGLEQKQVSKNKIEQKTTEKQTLLFTQLTKKKYQSLLKDFTQDKQKFVTVSNIVRARFCQSLIQKQLHEWISGKQDIFCKDIWNIKGEIHQSFQWLKLFTKMEIAYCSKLSISSGGNNELMTSIAVPAYNNLTHLNLAYNKLQNIEALAFIFAPNLKYIDIGDNFIVSLKPLTKIGSRKIQILKVYDNNFENIDLSRISLGSSIDQIVINIYQQRWQIIQDPNTVQDIRFLMKIQRGKMFIFQNYTMVNLINTYYIRPSRVNQVDNIFHPWIGYNESTLQKMREKFATKITQ